MPATSKMSFTPTGTPCSGPRSRPARASESRSRATARALSASTCAHARRSPSRARIRARHASTSSTALTVPERTASAASSTPSEAGSADRIENLRDDFEAAERGHQIGPGVARPHGSDELLRHLDPDAERAVPGLSKPAADLVGNRDTRHLVVQELGVARAVEREDADQNWNRRAARPLEETVDLPQLVHGLRLNPARPRPDLSLEAVDLPRHVLGRGVQGGADVERRRLADAAPGRVLSLVHPTQDLYQPHPVDVE